MAILITGSTGVIGTQVLNHLQGKGAAVRALTRDPRKATFPDGVVAVRGDLADLDAVRAAMKDVSTLFLLASNTPDELTQAISTMNVARDAGVKGVVYLSVFAGERFADVPHFTSKVAVERMVAQDDLPVTVLRPAYFMQNDVRMKDALRGPGVYGMPIGSKGISMVDVRDIGEAAARELLRREASPTPLGAETYALVGPDAIDGASVAALWSDVLGKTVRYGGDDLDALEERMRAAGPAWLAYDMRQMMRRYQQDGAAATESDLARLTALLGRPPRSYRAFAEETAAAWDEA